MNRRNRLRFKTDITVAVTLVEQPGSAMKGRLHNLSAHGLSVILSEELPPDSIARVEWGSTGFDGRLIYCKRHGQEFLAGFDVVGHIYDARKNSSPEDCDLPTSNLKVVT